MRLAESVLPAVGLTLTLAVVTTLFLVIIGMPAAWWLARSKARWKEFAAAFLSLPLVLPPTVLGFYLLVALGPQGPGGAVAGLWGGRTLAFSFPGLVIGSIIYSLPFMIGPLRAAFEGVHDELLETAATLGARPATAFFTIAAPLAWPGILYGLILSFAHTVGEFGVVLMIGGNIPGETKVLSIAIYDAVERLQWRDAHLIALGMVAFSFAVISATMIVGRNRAPAVG